LFVCIQRIADNPYLLHWLPPDVVVAVPGYGPDGCVMNANLHVPHQSVAPVMEGHDHPVT